MAGTYTVVTPYSQQILNPVSYPAHKPGDLFYGLFTKSGQQVHAVGLIDSNKNAWPLWQVSSVPPTIGFSSSGIIVNGTLHSFSTGALKAPTFADPVPDDHIHDLFTLAGGGSL
jgi:hypothetical protein